MNLLGQNASTITEVALAQFINDGRFAEHIRKMRRLYRDRRDTLIECLNESCSDFLRFKSSDAGMHIIADLKSGIADKTAYMALLNNGIESLPLSVYCFAPIERSALILGFSGVPRKRMPKLVKKMSQILSSIH
jgi:GntR family transcriptional regulator/MocR family aminotransferase